MRCAHRCTPRHNAIIGMSWPYQLIAQDLCWWLSQQMTDSAGLVLMSALLMMITVRAGE